MIDLTAQQISDAQNNDLAAITAVVQATEDRVTYLARHYATTGRHTDNELAEDLSQTGRIAVWESLNRFQGDSVAQFFGFIDKTLKGVMADARKVETRQGVSRSVAADFEYALKMAAGDAYGAERLVSDAGVMGKRRMSPEMAYAARLAYQGLEALDAPIPGSGGKGVSVADLPRTLGDTIPTTYGVPEDLIEADDINNNRRRKTTEQVHATLDKMGEAQRYILMALTGIGDVPEYGEDDEAIAAKLYNDTSRYSRTRVSAARSKGKARFATLYAAQYSL